MGTFQLQFILKFSQMVQKLLIEEIKSMFQAILNITKIFDFI